VPIDPLAKARALERLAADDAATPGERRNALAAAAKLRARAPSRVEPPPDPMAELLDELRRQAQAWHAASSRVASDGSPIHGPRCTGGPTYVGGPGCAECGRILAWRRAMRR
jgi:hypothetical protein